MYSSTTINDSNDDITSQNQKIMSDVIQNMGYTVIGILPYTIEENITYVCLCGSINTHIFRDLDVYHCKTCHISANETYSEAQHRNQSIEDLPIIMDDLRENTLDDVFRRSDLADTEALSSLSSFDEECDEWHGVSLK